MFAKVADTVDVLFNKSSNVRDNRDFSQLSVHYSKRPGIQKVGIEEQNLTFPFCNEDLTKRLRFNGINTLKTQQKIIYVPQNFVTSTPIKDSGSMFSGSLGDLSSVKPSIARNLLLSESMKARPEIDIMQESSFTSEDVDSGIENITERFSNLDIEDDSSTTIGNFTDWREKSGINRDYGSQSTLASIEKDLDVSVNFGDANEIDSDVSCLAEKLANSFKKPEIKKENSNDSILECQIQSALKPVDNSLQDDEGYHSSRKLSHSSDTTGEGLQENNKSYSNEQKIKDLPQIIKIVNQSQDTTSKHEHSKSRKSYVLSCVAGGCIGLAIAYFTVAATLTYIGIALAGVLIAYGITKLCEVKTKIENPCAKQHAVQEIELGCTK